MTPPVASPRGAITVSKRFWIPRVFTAIAGLGLQLVGLYAIVVTFGVWITAALYAVGVLALVVQRLALGRISSCSPGD